MLLHTVAFHSILGAEGDSLNLLRVHVLSSVSTGDVGPADKYEPGSELAPGAFSVDAPTARQGGVKEPPAAPPHITSKSSKVQALSLIHI